MNGAKSEGVGAGYRFGSSIPVLRMLDEALARSFYVDFLGFEVDWEHRFRDDAQSPLYMQVSQGASVLHLNGHADSDSPVCEVRIPVDGLQAYCESLSAKAISFPSPEVVDPRYEGRKTDINVLDPFGNHLVFWSPSEPDSQVE
jgi:catechol 2,3-dioxygenase-like lactoylglutathione lyase family enzyme